MDAPEMDIGKLLQSLVCNYQDWKKETNLVTQKDATHFAIPEKYLEDKFEKVNCLMDAKLYQKGILYMAIYFIRMIPFMKAISNEMALFIELLAMHWLSTCVN